MLRKPSDNNLYKISRQAQYKISEKSFHRSTSSLAQYLQDLHPGGSLRGHQDLHKIFSQGPLIPTPQAALLNPAQITPLSTFFCIYLHLYLHTSLSRYLFIYLSSHYLSFYQFIDLSTYPSIHIIHLSILSIYLSTCLF